MMEPLSSLPTKNRSAQESEVFLMVFAISLLVYLVLRARILSRTYSEDAEDGCSYGYPRTRNRVDAGTASAYLSVLSLVANAESCLPEERRYHI